MSIFLEQFLMKRRREERGWLNVLFPTFIITRRMGWTVRHVCTLQWQRNWGRCHPLCGNTPGLSLQLTFPAFLLPPLQWAVLPSPVRYQEIHWASGRPLLLLTALTVQVLQCQPGGSLRHRGGGGGGTQWGGDSDGFVTAVQQEIESVWYQYYPV